MTTPATPADEAHTAAYEAIEEVNAAIGAAISTGTLPPELHALLHEIQHELLDLADAVDSGRPGPSLDRLRHALQTHRAEAPSAGAAVLGGLSNAAGLLKWARAITRRALRAMTALAVPPGRRTYLELLEQVLLAVALRAEALERTHVPYGVC